jgi:hypothetical protein
MVSGDSNPRDAQQQVIDRAGTDPAFRAQLIQNPRDAINAQLGISLPDGVAVRVIEEQPGEVVLVLPNQTMGSGTRLSGEDLENVAGGCYGGAQSMCVGTWTLGF